MDIQLFLVHADDHQPVLSHGMPASDAYDAPQSATAPLESSRQNPTGPEDSLPDQRWAIVAPTGPEGDRLLGLVQPLRKLREEQQGEKALEYRVEPGMGPAAAADWIQGPFWDAVGRDEERLPRYLLLLGDPTAVSWDLQQALDADTFVGRLAFANDEGYEAYVHKVVASERQDFAPGARLLFYTVEDGTAATILGRQALMKPSLETAKQRQASGTFPAHEIVEIEGSADLLAGAQAMLGKAESSAPSILFSMSHGAGVPRVGWRSLEEQRALQGAMVLTQHGDRLTAPDVATRPFLPGGVWIYFACYGAGTPSHSAYYPWMDRLNQLGHGTVPDRVLRALPQAGEPPFVASLPQAALANPNGPLGIIGHVDLAWTWSFRPQNPSPGEASLQRRDERFQGLLRALVHGHRLGVAHYQLARFVRRIAMEHRGLERETIQRRSADSTGEDTVLKARLSGLWMQEEDLRAFVLLGDPAARLQIAQRPAGV